MNTNKNILGLSLLATTALRYTNESGANGGMAIDNDPLNTNVDDINTDYPVLPAGHYNLRAEDCVVEPNKKGTGNNLVVPVVTMEEYRDLKGESVAPGMKITTYISLAETAGGELNSATGKPKKAYTIDDIKKGVARVAKALGVQATVRQIIDNPAMLNGKVVSNQKVKVNAETAEFKASNAVAW